MKQMRQGDVLLIELSEDQVPAEKGTRVEPEDGRLILVRGEATGHHHSVAASSARLFESAIGMLLFVDRATKLLHQEHAAVQLRTATYLALRQQEYTPQGLRNVAD